jgi:hypothetical protein
LESQPAYSILSSDDRWSHSPHTTAYYYMCPHTTMCLLTTAYVHMCPHATTTATLYVSSCYYISICVLILQVPLEHPGCSDRWSHSPPELRLAFEMFIENVYAERDRDVSRSTEGQDAARCRLRPPDFPRLSHSAWSWFTRDNRAASSTGCAGAPPFFTSSTSAKAKY